MYHHWMEPERSALGNPPFGDLGSLLKLTNNLAPANRPFLEFDECDA